MRDNLPEPSPSGTLTRGQVAFFRHAGYLVLDARLSSEVVIAVRDSVLSLLSPAVGYQRVSQIVQRDKQVRELIATSGALLDPVESLLGRNIELLLNRHNHLTLAAGSGPAGRLHRDVLQWSRTIVSAVVQLGEVADPRAATWVLPGSHFLPFVGEPNNGGTWLDEYSVYQDLAGQAVPVPMSSGSILLVDGVLFHRAGRSPQDKDRLTLTVAYRAVDELTKPEDRGSETVLVRGERLYRGND